MVNGISTICIVHGPATPVLLAAASALKAKKRRLRRSMFDPAVIPKPLVLVASQRIRDKLMTYILRQQCPVNSPIFARKVLI